MSTETYDDNDVVKAAWVKWGKVGNYIQGTLISVSDQMQVNQYSGKEENARRYEIKADAGQFNDIDDEKQPIEPAIDIKEGEIWTVGDHFTIHNSLKNIKVGTKLKIEFFETKKSKTKGNAPMKVRRVLSKGTMDQEWLDEQDADNF